MKNVVDSVQFVFFLLQVVGVESVVYEFYCRVFVLFGVVRRVWDDGVGKGGFSVYGGFHVRGGSVFGCVKIV